MTYMLTANEEKIAHEWKKYKGYTIRPLPSTCQYYDERIKAYTAENKFLILGGTPEIRSIFQTLNFPVTIVDQSKTVVRAMGKLTFKQRPFSNLETYIETNWLNLNSLNRKFDVVIGDDAI